MKLDTAKSVLVFAVGGGNDSVSTLLLQKQLQVTFGYNPDSIDIVAMLPDCLDYSDMQTTDYHTNVLTINDHSKRHVNGKHITAFPEVILSQNRKKILPIDTIYGISMKNGSVGVLNAITSLVNSKNYDLILAIDVGGDFIAVEDNIEVLSPMMDGYMLYAFSNLETKIPIIYSVFGLGTDGESTPAMLDRALERLPNLYVGSFQHNDVKEFIEFYRSTVEPNRYSRTTDFTIKEITGEGHPNPAVYRGRFHVDTAVHYGVFNHKQDEKFYGKYYLFDDISQVKNIFSEPCYNGFEWFMNVQKQTTRINHELNGQSYVLDGKTVFFGTPSRKFTEEQQITIAAEIYKAVQNGIYDTALIYQCYADLTTPWADINNDLTLIGKDAEVVKAISTRLYQLNDIMLLADLVRNQ